MKPPTKTEDVDFKSDSYYAVNVTLGVIFGSFLLFHVAYGFPNWFAVKFGSEIVNDTKGAYQSLGEIGDAFGALNTVFSGLAFLAIVAALFLQRQDIRINSRALKQMEKDFKEQKNHAAAMRRYELAKLQHELLLSELNRLQTRLSSLTATQNANVLIANGQDIQRTQSAIASTEKLLKLVVEASGVMNELNSANFAVQEVEGRIAYLRDIIAQGPDPSTVLPRNLDEYLRTTNQLIDMVAEYLPFGYETFRLRSDLHELEAALRRIFPNREN